MLALVSQSRSRGNTNFAESTFGATYSVIEKIFGSKEDITETQKRIDELELSITSLSNRAAEIRASNQTEDPEGRGLVGEIVNGLTPQGIALFDAEKALQDSMTDLAKEGSNARIDLAKIEAQQKIEALQRYGQAFESLAGIVGEQTAVGKVLASA